MGLVVGIGANAIRKQVAESYSKSKFVTVVHPSAALASTVKLGKGTVVFANAVINSEAKVGEHCIINIGAIVEHDCRISDFVHISPGAVLAGGVVVGSEAWVGAGAVIKNGVKLGNRCIVGAGAVVLSDVPDDSTVVGNPARVLSPNETKELVIMGSGGWCVEVIQLVTDINSSKNGRWVISAIVDQDPKVNHIQDIPVLPWAGFLDSYLNKSISIAIAISNPESRKQISQILDDLGCDFPNLIHPSVSVPSDLRIGKGNLISSGCILSPQLRLGDFNAVNFQSLLAHHVGLGNYNTLAPRVQLSGNVSIGNSNNFGSNSVVLPGIQVGHSNEIFAMSVVDRSLPNDGKYGGIPIRRLN